MFLALIFSHDFGSATPPPWGSCSSSENRGKDYACLELLKRLNEVIYVKFLQHCPACPKGQLSILSSSQPCFHFTDKQSEVLSTSLTCLRIQKPEIRVAKAHRFPSVEAELGAITPLEHIGRIPGARKDLPFCPPRAQSFTRAVWDETQGHRLCTGLARVRILPYPLAGMLTPASSVSPSGNLGL